VFVSLILIVSTSTVECLKRFVSEMTYYVSSGMLNKTLDTDLLTNCGLKVWEFCTACRAVCVDT